MVQHVADWVAPFTRSQHSLLLPSNSSILLLQLPLFFPPLCARELGEIIIWYFNSYLQITAKPVNRNTLRPLSQTDLVRRDQGGFQQFPYLTFYTRMLVTNLYPVWLWLQEQLLSIELSKPFTLFEKCEEKKGWFRSHVVIGVGHCIVRPRKRSPPQKPKETA